LFVATCLENDIASQGKTIDESVANLKETMVLYYEDEVDAEMCVPCFARGAVTDKFGVNWNVVAEEAPGPEAE
jgi:hypothetical protein